MPGSKLILVSKKSGISGRTSGSLRSKGRIVDKCGRSWEWKVSVVRQQLYMSIQWESHYSDVTVGTMASQITSLTIVYSSVYSDADKKHTPKLRVTGLCAGNSPVTGEFPAQKASNRQNASIWWRHHGESNRLSIPGVGVTTKLRSLISPLEKFWSCTRIC